MALCPASALEVSMPRKSSRKKILSTCLAVAFPAVARATPNVQNLSDSHGSYYLVNNGPLAFQLYSTGSLAGKITSITYDAQQMAGSKDLYYDIQGSPYIYLDSSE